MFHQSLHCNDCCILMLLPKACKIQSDSSVVAHSLSGNQVHIHFCHAQKEGKHMVRQVLGCPNNFQTNWRMSFIVVVIGGVTIEEVVTHHFRGVESGSFFHYMVIHLFSFCLLATALLRYLKCSDHQSRPRGIKQFSFHVI